MILDNYKKTMKLMKIGRWAFDIISFIIYFLITNILKGIYGITTAFIMAILLLIAGLILRAILIVRPYNSLVDYINNLEEQKIA